MTKRQAPKQSMGLLGYSVCFDDPDAAPETSIPICGVNASVLAPMVRRRTSLATKMAVTALDQACSDANVDANMPVIFTSSVGEMAVTDQLCGAIAKTAFPLSPTLFHNSVHNTSAGYWSISVDSMAPMQSMAGLEDSFAMGLLEASCQLDHTAAQVLLVGYDEAMPAQLLPDYAWAPCAIALVLGDVSESNISLSRPYTSGEMPFSDDSFSRHNPAMAGLSLLQHIDEMDSVRQRICISNGRFPWYVNLEKRND